MIRQAAAEFTDSLRRNPPLFRFYDKAEGFRISRATRDAFAALAVAATVATVAATVAFVLTASVAAANVLVVSSVALGIILGVGAYTLLHPHLPKSFQRSANYVKAFSLDILAKFVLGFSYPLSRVFRNPVNEANKGRQQPVLLVHGYLSCAGHWWYILYRLMKAGYTEVYTVNLGTPFHSIEEFSERLGQRVQEIKEETGSSSIKIIGHSMGGVVASYYAANEMKEGEVSDIITIASPLQGTNVARLGPGRCAEQMRRQCPFIMDLYHKIERLREEGKIRFFHTGSETDLTIRPASSTLAKTGQEGTRFFSSLGHVSFLFSDATADWILDIITSQLTYGGQLQARAAEGPVLTP